MRTSKWIRLDMSCLVYISYIDLGNINLPPPRSRKSRPATAQSVVGPHASQEEMPLKPKSPSCAGELSLTIYRKLRGLNGFSGMAHVSDITIWRHIPKRQRLSPPAASELVMHTYTSSGTGLPTTKINGARVRYLIKRERNK